jgi:hypothetical protein
VARLSPDMLGIPPRPSKMPFGPCRKFMATLALRVTSDNEQRYLSTALSASSVIGLSPQARFQCQPPRGCAARNFAERPFDHEVALPLWAAAATANSRNSGLHPYSLGFGSTSCV